MNLQWPTALLSTLLAVELAMDDERSPLSPEELVLMHRHGDEPFSWEAGE